MATAAENEPMFRGRRGIRERLRGLARAVLRRSGPNAPLSRRNWAFDAGLAFALGLIAILTAGNDDVSGEVGPLPPGTFPSLPPERPLPPGPEPYGTVPWAEWGGLALLLVFIAAPLAFRRRYPLSMLWVVLVTASFTLDVGDEAPLRLSFYVCVIAAYSAAVYSPYRIPALASLPAAALLFQEFQSDANEPALRGAITAVQGEHAEAVRRATARERARIARELHDVVTHNVSVMVIQAGAARKILDSEPARAREALLAVEAGGRAAMTELRHVMGLLTIDSDESEPELAPQPGLSQVEPLVERVRAAGVPVELVVTGAPGPLPDGVDLAAYRVVQEALTNTVKHAAGAAAMVRIDHGADQLWIEVTDAGGPLSGSERTEPSGMGQGLIGLHERLAVYGGSLQAGPRIRGGYRVEAVIPFDTADMVRLPLETQ